MGLCLRATGERITPAKPDTLFHSGHHLDLGAGGEPPRERRDRIAGVVDAQCRLRHIGQLSLVDEPQRHPARRRTATFRHPAIADDVSETRPGGSYRARALSTTSAADQPNVHGMFRRLRSMSSSLDNRWPLRRPLTLALTLHLPKSSRQNRPKGALDRLGRDRMTFDPPGLRV